MRTVFSCRRFFDALTVAVVLPLLSVVGVMPVSTHAQEPPSVDSRDIPAQTLFSQAVSLERESPKDALVKYDEVMSRFGRATTPGSRQFAARALLNKGSILGKNGDDKEAISTLDRIDRNFGNEKSAAIREVLASALVSKAEIFYKQGDVNKTIDIYDQLNKQFSNDESDFIKRLIDISEWRVAEIRARNNTALSSRP